MRLLVVLLAASALLVAASGFWLPLPGTLLVDTDPLAPAAVALVLDGVSQDALDRAEGWRRDGLVGRVVVVEAPIKTHALVTYWTELVARGLARPSLTPPELLAVVRARSLAPAEQARAALPTLQAARAQSVLVPGGVLSGRLDRRELARVLGPAGITVRLVREEAPDRDPGRWYLDAADRRRVLGVWLQLLVPALSGDPQGPGT